jgi:hypothetical protein
MWWYLPKTSLHYSRQYREILVWWIISLLEIHTKNWLKKDQERIHELSQILDVKKDMLWEFNQISIVKKIDVKQFTIIICNL